MKKIIRRLTAFALCAILAAAMPLASAQELFTPEGVLLTVQIAVTLPNGTLSFLPVTPVTSTMGDTVYWVDESMLSDDEIALLATAQLQLTSETGELYAELPLSDVGFAGAIDERLDIVNDMIPGGVLTVLPATLTEDELTRRARDTDALVVMKIGRNLAKLKRALAAAGKLDAAWLIVRGTMPEQQIHRLAEVSEAPYFSTAVIHGQGRRP